MTIELILVLVYKVQRQMANAARTMGLSGMQNLNNGEGKINGSSHNQMKMETENSPANNQNNQVCILSISFLRLIGRFKKARHKSH